MKVQKLDPARLAMFNGGIGQTVGTPPPRPPRTRPGPQAPISRSLPSELQVIAKKPVTDSNPSPTTGALVGTTGTGDTLNLKPTLRRREFDPEKRAATMLPRGTIVQVCKEQAWQAIPNAQQLLKFQPGHSNGQPNVDDSSGPPTSKKGYGTRIPVNPAYGHMKSVQGHSQGSTPISRPYGTIIPAKPAYGKMEPVSGHSKGNIPFGNIVSESIAGEHRVKNVRQSDNTQRQVIFKHLLTVQGLYIGEQVRYALTPDDYKITINKEDFVNKQGLLVKKGLLINSLGQPVTANDAKFVVNKYGDWFMAKIHETGILHHSFFTKGGPVGMAGHMTANNGELSWYEPRSGHYQPKEEHVEQFNDFLSQYKVKVSADYVAPSPYGPAEYNSTGDLPAEHNTDELPEDYRNDREKWRT